MIYIHCSRLTSHEQDTKTLFGYIDLQLGCNCRNYRTSWKRLRSCRTEILLEVSEQRGFPQHWKEEGNACAASGSREEHLHHMD